MSLKTKNEIQSAFDNLFETSDEEKIERKADVLALSFLSEIDKAMSTLKINKKELAKEVGTSASYITQLFRGDRKPNWTMLAKMSEAVNIDFHVMTNKDYLENLYSPKGDSSGFWVYKPFEKPEADTLTDVELDSELNPMAI